MFPTGLSRTRALLLGGTVVFVVAVVSFVWMQWQGRPDVRPVQERRPMPAVHLNLISGGTWQLRDHRGEVVAINYWASWCGPCWEETPMLVRLSREFGNRGFAIVGVATDERTSQAVPSAVRNFVEKLNVSYPIAMTAPMSQVAYGMEGMPTTILVDREGRVAQTYVGALKESRFRADVEALLREPAQEQR